MHSVYVKFTYIFNIETVEFLRSFLRVIFEFLRVIIKIAGVS